MPRTFFAELFAIFAVGTSFLLFQYLGEMDLIPAALWALAVYLSFKATVTLLSRWRWVGGEPDEESSPWDSVSLDTPGGRARFQVLFERYGIVGSMNVRDGHVYPVVPAEKLDDLTKTLRAAVGMTRRIKLAGTDLYVAQTGRAELENMRIVGLTVHQLEQVLGVMERCVEERFASRKLYRGFGREEIMRMARTATADFIAKQPSASSDNLIIANSIRRGECDDNEFVRVSARTVELILQIKGSDV